MIKVIIFSTIGFSVLNPLSFSQNKNYADSLKELLTFNKDLSDTLRISIINELIVKTNDPDEVILFSQRLINISNGRFLKEEIDANHTLGVAYRMKGELETALEFLFNCVRLSTKSNLKNLAAEAYLEIGTTYFTNNDVKNAAIYQNKAINIFRELDKTQELAITLLNTGFSCYYSTEKYDTALLYYNEAAPLFDSVDLTIGKAYTIGNRALVYWKTGKAYQAEEDLLKAIEMLVPLGDQFGMADYHNQLGNLYLEQGKITSSIYHLQKGLEMAREMDLKEQIRDASLLLSQLNSSQGKYEEAFGYHEQYVAYKDSIENSEQTKKMADLRTEFEVNLREKEIDTLEKEKALQQTYIAIAIILCCLALILVLYFRQRLRNARLVAEAERTRHGIRVQDLLKSQETKALQAMVKGKEEERRYLAKEIHNHLGSLLATVKVNLNGLDLGDTSKQHLIVNLVDRACQDVRNISHELNMGVSENFGLVPALKELVTHLQQSNEIQLEFTTSLVGIHIESQNEILAYRIVQELVSNVLKHAQATKLTLSLTGFEEEGIVNILVQDNGRGFDPKKQTKAKKGIGLESLREMVETIEGEMSVDSHAQSGTTVSIDLPVISREISIEEP